MRKRVCQVALVLVSLLVFSAGSASAHDPSLHPTLDPAAPPKREIDMAAIMVAGAAIVVAGGAGVWIYRVIRKGL